VLEKQTHWNVTFSYAAMKRPGVIGYDKHQNRCNHQQQNRTGRTAEDLNNLPAGIFQSGQVNALPKLKV